MVRNISEASRNTSQPSAAQCPTAALLATPTTTVGAADYTVLTKLSSTCCYRGAESLTLTVAVTKGAAQLTARGGMYACILGTALDQTG
eukprot:COSAG02_NODE_152_length_33208_cov_13.316591_22_plen_89_part_00